MNNLKKRLDSSSTMRNRTTQSVVATRGRMRSIAGLSGIFIENHDPQFS